MSLDQLSKTFDAFVQEAHRLKDLYADRIVLLVGLETEFVTGDDDMAGLERLLERHGDHIEYLVGSVHHVNTIPIDFDLHTFQHAVNSFGNAKMDYSQALEHLLLSYFDAQYDLMRRCHPEIIGHFDLCRLYHPSLRFQDHPTVWAKIERNVQYAAEYGALFELNAAAFRKGWDDAYPGSDVVQVSCFHCSDPASSQNLHEVHNQVGRTVYFV